MNFNERILFVVRNFIEYGSYGRDRKKAAKIIHRHHPDISLSGCQEYFDIYSEVYSDTISFVNTNKEHYWALKKNPPDGTWPVTIEETAFFQKHDNVPEDIIRSMIWFIFDWHHVR